MKRTICQPFCIALVAAGILASMLGGRALRHAITECRNLYRVDTAGLQIESDLEFEIQESRRAFLYALTTPDPNEQLPYIDQARRSSDRVAAAVERLRRIQSSEIDPNIKLFEYRWSEYCKDRDETIALVLEGDPKAAMMTEEARGKSAFIAALENLHALKSTLEKHARAASARVDRTLWQCVVGLGLFTLITVVVVSFLGKSNRDRKRVLQSLSHSNLALENAREKERRRAAVLELVSAHAPLSRTLRQVLELARQSSSRSGAAIWAEAGTDLNFEAAESLPERFREALGELVLPKTEDSAEWLELAGKRSDLSAREGLVAAESRVLRDAAGRIIGLLEVFSPSLNDKVEDDILAEMAYLAGVAIENTLLYDRLAFQAHHDILTELPNRVLFQDRVQQAMHLARRHRKRAALMWIDLDRYKQINDTLGHRAGDEVLCEIGRRLKTCLRQSDTVARVGGDEFTVLTQDVASPEDAIMVSRKILAELARPMRLGEHDAALTASIGISIFPDHGEDPIMLMRHADLAMYNAKRSGGGTFCVFYPALGEHVLRRIQIERELQTALENGEFALHYQPLVDSRGRVEGLEALLRWTNRALGPVSPADFVPIAEEMGLIHSIGAWVTRVACETGARWLREGVETPNLAVNVSAAQFAGHEFELQVIEALRETGFPASKLVIEITETLLMNNLDRALQQMLSLRRLGVRFALDDFGTGYSSLSQLRSLPVDWVKIDRSFIRDIETPDKGSATLVRGIIALAHSLGLSVVAEGVENLNQIHILRSMGCDVNQGFYLHRPMPPADVERLLRNPETDDRFLQPFEFANPEAAFS